MGGAAAGGGGGREGVNRTNHRLPVLPLEYSLTRRRRKRKEILGIIFST